MSRFVQRLFTFVIFSYFVYFPYISVSAAPIYPAKLKGMSLASWTTTGFNTSGGQQTYKNMLVDNPNCIALVLTWYQYSIYTTSIYRTGNTESDSDLIYAINEAHSAGKCVMIKPHVDLQTSGWRGSIGGNFTSSQWQTWFQSYQNMIYHYATLASQNSVEFLCIGTELLNSSKQTTLWTNTIAGIRSRYYGKITYSANHDGEETGINWWDKVDYIGISAYYDLTNHADPSMSELLAAWSPIVSRLASLSAKWGKSIIFTEVGYRSVAGTNTRPWDYSLNTAVDMPEQSNCYQALLQSFWNQSWFKGVFWWSWDLNPNVGGSSDKSYTPYKKTAESTLKTWYSTH